MASMWTVYDHPKDFPDLWVARRLALGSAVYMQTEEILTAPTLEELRALLPRGLLRLPPFAGDEPQIAEVWI